MWKIGTVASVTVKAPAPPKHHAEQQRQARLSRLRANLTDDDVADQLCWRELELQRHLIYWHAGVIFI